MAVTLTDRAAIHVQRYIEKRGKGVGLRLGVKTTGSPRTPSSRATACA
jgi:iron-sulfur cluster assembly protein